MLLLLLPSNTTLTVAFGGKLKIVKDDMPGLLSREKLTAFGN